jgi:hypothetical protein
VRDPSRETPDAFHLLGVEQLFLEPLSLGDVLHTAVHARDSSAQCIPDRTHVIPKPAHLARLRHDSVFEDPDFPVRMLSE